MDNRLQRKVLSQILQKAELPYLGYKNLSHYMEDYNYNNIITL